MTPESHQTLVSLFGALSRLVLQYEWVESHYVFVFQLFAQFPCYTWIYYGNHNFLVSIPARVSLRVVRVHAYFLHILGPIPVLSIANGSYLFHAAQGSRGRTKRCHKT